MCVHVHAFAFPPPPPHPTHLPLSHPDSVHTRGEERGERGGGGLKHVDVDVETC